MTTDLEPVTNQEIPVIADRVARGLIAYLLTEGRNFLGDAIGEALGDDPDADRFDSYIRGKVYGLVWDQLGRAAAEYQPRDHVLTEAAEILLADTTVMGEPGDQYAVAYASLLLAARTGQETAERQEGGQCPQNSGGEHAFRPVALDPGRFCTYCGNPEAGVR